MMNQNDNLIPVVKGPYLKKMDVFTISGYLPISQLKERTTVDYFKSDAQPGEKNYQRLPTPKRVKQISDGLAAKKFDVPTAVTFNIREGQWKPTYLEEHDGSLFLNLDKLREDNVQFHTVDGQHRRDGYAKMLGKFEEDAIGEESLELDEWKDFKIPFVSTIGASANDEMIIFYEINSNAVGVVTNLAYSLMEERRESDPGYAMELISTDQNWKAHGSKLSKVLNEDAQGVWYQRIRMPNTLEKGKTTVQSSGFTNSLKKLLQSNFFI